MQKLMLLQCMANDPHVLLPDKVLATTPCAMGRISAEDWTLPNKSAVVPLSTFLKPGVMNDSNRDGPPNTK